MICEGLRDLAVSTSTVPKADPRMFVVAAKGAEAPIDELKAVISEVAISIHGVYVSKSSSQYPEYNQLRLVNTHVQYLSRKWVLSLKQVLMFPRQASCYQSFVCKRT